MNESNQTAELFRSIARVLLRCWLLGFMLLLIWFGAVVLAGDAILRLHGPLFGLSKHELELIFYCGLGLLKLAVLTLFFIPWLAIKLVPWTRQS